MWTSKSTANMSFAARSRAAGPRGSIPGPDGENPVTVNTAGASIDQHMVDVGGGNWETSGIYNLRGFQITDNGQTRTKPISTMFPDHCSEDNVLQAIADASQDQNRMSGASCQTDQDASFPIQVYWLNGYINSAFPIVQ